MLVPQLQLQLHPQLGEVELPSDVTPLPIDIIAWSALALGVFLGLHLYVQWLLQRKPSAFSAIPENPAAPVSSVLEELQDLRAATLSLSADQLAEALSLSLLIRRANRHQWSATDEELLAHCSATSGSALQPILHFTSRILFARCPATKEQWSEVLLQTETWWNDLAEGQA
ncbi:MAG: hypothetical protein COA70_00530 [Planctomycetota bacterium]|nr:MAG: hypothetical protein COA70_00530 [Planctomycetota bacterium]